MKTLLMFAFTAVTAVAANAFCPPLDCSGSSMSHDFSAAPVGNYECFPEVCHQSAPRPGSCHAKHDICPSFFATSFQDVDNLEKAIEQHSLRGIDRVVASNVGSMHYVIDREMLIVQGCGKGVIAAIPLPLGVLEQLSEQTRGALLQAHRQSS